MLLRRKLLILLKQENERSASQLPTGRVHAIFSKTAMLETHHNQPAEDTALG